MEIRNANTNDAVKIGLLLDQLGYPTRKENLIYKIIQLINHPDHLLVVYDNKGVEAVMSVHFIPQIGLEGYLAIISYLAVDEASRSGGIGKKLEKYCVREARARRCDRIQVHCSLKRTDAHRFYQRQGYEESRIYFSKKLK